jgi:hypothetical protein
MLFRLLVVHHVTYVISSNPASMSEPRSHHVTHKAALQMCRAVPVMPYLVMLMALQHTLCFGAAVIMAGKNGLCSLGHIRSMTVSLEPWQKLEPWKKASSGICLVTFSNLLTEPDTPCSGVR